MRPNYDKLIQTSFSFNLVIDRDPIPKYSNLDQPKSDYMHHYM